MTSNLVAAGVFVRSFNFKVLELIELCAIWLGCTSGYPKNGVENSNIGMFKE